MAILPEQLREENMITLETEGRILTFNVEQEEATNEILEWYKSNERFFLLAGYAGTGKTTITKYIIRTIRSQKKGVKDSSSHTFPNTKICVCAPTHKAKKVIERATGLPGHTLQRLLGLSPDINVDEFDPNKPEFVPKRPAILKDYDFVVLDEASMVNTELFKFINKELNKTGVTTKILILADPAQLPPIKEKLSPIFDSPLVTHKYLLTLVERQANDNPALYILDTIRNDTSVRFDQFEHTDALSPDGDGVLFMKTVDFTSEVKRQFASDAYSEDPDYAKVLVWTNDMAAMWNTGIRKHKMELMHPGKEILPVMSGDVLMAYAGYENKIQNSNDYLVLASERSELDITYPGKDGQQILVRVKTYATRLKNVDTGVILFTHILDQSKKENVSNYLKAYWAYIGAAKAETSAWQQFFAFRSWVMLMEPIQLGAGDKKIGKDLDYGYAITIHKSLATGSYKTYLIDWDLLRASYTLFSSNDWSIVKETKIGQSAAKLPYRKNVHRLSRKGVHLLLA